jgi:hypothetical protein
MRAYHPDASMVPASPRSFMHSTRMPRACGTHPSFILLPNLPVTDLSNNSAQMPKPNRHGLGHDAASSCSRPISRSRSRVYQKAPTSPSVPGAAVKYRASSCGATKHFRCPTSGNIWRLVPTVRRPISTASRRIHRSTWKAQLTMLTNIPAAGVERLCSISS